MQLRSMQFRSLLAGTCLALLAPTIAAAPCAVEDFQQQVSGQEQCLRLRSYGGTKPTTLLVWLHGDVSSGGPANYHFAQAEQAAATFSAANIQSVALVRPGYPDGSGQQSTVKDPHRRRDHYSRDNTQEVGAAIARLRAHFQAQRVILVGHSGGAATAALLLGMQPTLADAALLVACPCDLGNWRSFRGSPWPYSEDPLQWAEHVNPKTRIIALTGSRDDNTLPEFAERYVQALQARQGRAEFRLVSGESHNSVFRASAVTTALRELLQAP